VAVEPLLFSRLRRAALELQTLVAAAVAVEITQ
jgi:hypothetical protein